ncbi:MAG: acyl-CoA dehydrogenase family protein [Pseudomonas sp.]
MNELNELFRATAEGIFSDSCTKALMDRAEQGEWPADVWSAIEELGLTSAIDSENNELLPLETIGIIVRAAGEYHLPLPLTETLLAQRALFRASCKIPSGPLSIAATNWDLLPNLKGNGAGWLLTGELHRVPWGRNVSAVVFIAQGDDGELKLVTLENHVPHEQGASLAAEPRDSYVFASIEVPEQRVTSISRDDAERMGLEGALFRSLQMVGAMSKILSQTVQYSLERVQFGRPIARFQAVQHQVAFMATQVAASTAAVEAAINALENNLSHFEVYAAKGRASESAGICCNVGHQVHGAIGFTHEHSLHLASRRLMVWRDEYGSETECYEWIGEAIQKVGGDGLWPFITTPHETVGEYA